MASTKMFRNSLSGYNKEDVNKYIRETDSAHAEELEVLRADAAKAEAKIAELTEQNNTLTDSLSSVKAEADTLRNEKAEIEERDMQLGDAIRANMEEIDTLKKELNFHKADCESQKNVISTLRSERDALLSEIETLKSSSHAPMTEAQSEDIISDDRDSDQYKLDMYNKISSQLGDIIINANRTAEEIVSRAKNEAESLKSSTDNEIREKKDACNAEIAKIKNDSEEEAAYIRKRLSDIAEELLSRVSADLHNSIDSSVREINTYVSDVQYEIKALATKIEARSDEMYDRLGYYRTTVSEGIDKKLCDMDKKYGIKKTYTETK